MNQIHSIGTSQSTFSLKTYTVYNIPYLIPVVSGGFLIKYDYIEYDSCPVFWSNISSLIVLHPTIECFA